MKSAKQPSGPLIKKVPDAQALKEQDAKFRSTFVQEMRSSSPPRSEPVVLPEAIVVPGVSAPTAPKPLPLVQPAAKSGVSSSKAPAKKAAAKSSAKSGSKAGSKSGSKTSAKSGVKAGGKSGAKVGTLIMKRSEPLNLESLTSREELKEPEESKSLTQRDLKPEEPKQGVDEGVQDADFQDYLRKQESEKLSLEKVVNDSLSIASRVPPVVKLLQTLAFKRLVKPVPDLYFCESLSSVFATDRKPCKDLKVAKLDVMKFAVITKPQISFLFTETQAFRVVNKPNPRISFTEQVVESYSVMHVPQRNLFMIDTHCLSFEVREKPVIDFFLYIPFDNFPLAPTLEVIEEFDLSKFQVRAITTHCLNYKITEKPAVDMVFDEDCFTSKFPVLVPSVKLMKNLQIEEEDWKIRRGPPVIEILATLDFEMTEKPEVDIFFYQREFVEMCLQTDEILEENKENDENQENNDVLTFDEFIAKIEVTPKNANTVNFQFVDEALQKMTEMETIKKEVKDRENLKFKRNKAAGRIQAWVRGFLARRKYIPPILEVYKERLRSRKLREIAGRIKKSWAPYVVLNALQKWYQVKLREKQRLFRLFLNFSAISIQKQWRGFIIRKFYREKLMKRAKGKIKLRRMLRNWKCRKIMSTRRLKHILKGLKDTKQLILEIQYERSSAKMYQQLQAQLVSYSNKLRTDFNTLYQSGKWTNLPSQRDSISMLDSVSSFKFNQQEEPTEFVPTQPRPPLNREDIPIRPLAMNYEDLLKDFPEQPLTTPPAKPRRKKLRRQDEKKIEESPKVFVFNENLEEVRQDDVPKPPPQPKNFLKRKSKSVKPQKVDWKVKKRIDCWLPKEKMKKKEPSFEIQNIIPRGDFLSLEEIEKEYRNDLSAWISLELFFDRAERDESKVPQIGVDSICLKRYAESNHTGHIEDMESHYAYLCSEDVLSG